MVEDVVYFGLDFESNGTDPVNSRIIEVGVVVTDHTLENRIFTFESMVKDGDTAEVIQSIEKNPVLNRMHGSNGLLGDLYRMKNGELESVTMEELDRILYSMVKEHVDSDKKIVLAGSGVSHYDHNVIKARMPLLSSLLTYYTKDIGHLRRAYYEAIGEDLIDVNDNKTHRALQDIEDHMNEALAFRQFFVKAKLALSLVDLD